MGPVTPFGNIGLGNTISDTQFYTRPFTSLGLAAHFEGGATVTMAPMVTLGGSAFSVRAAGTQTVFSRVVDRPFVRGPGPALGRDSRVFEVAPEVRVPADLVHDHGFSTWIGLNPDTDYGLQVGYSRSFPYDYDSLYFGINFKIGSLRR
jgi:hypothetical protein